MQFSQRISSLPGSPTVALNAKAKELARAGRSVLNFAVGEPDLPTPELIVETAVTALRAGRTKYGPSGGGLPLREAICAKLARENGLNFQPQEVIAGVGAKELLFHLSLALLNEGDEVLIPAPYWVSYPTHAQAAGATAKIIPMPDNPNQPLSAEALRLCATNRTKMLIINSPNNPAGYVLSKQNLQQIAEVALELNCWIVSDEIYEYMTYSGKEHLSLLQICPELRSRFILIHGMSKGYAMTGWRVGYMCAPAAVCKIVDVLQSQSSTCLPGFIEDASVVALNSGRALVGDLLKRFEERSKLCSTLLNQVPEITFWPLDGAFYAFIDCRNFLSRCKQFVENDSLTMSQRLLEESELALVPGEAFGAPGFLRFSYATSEDTIKAGLGRFREFVQSHL